MQEKMTLDKLMDLLSDEDRAIFAQLATKLKSVKGDINQLSPSDSQTIQQMEQKYADQFSQLDETTAVSELGESQIKQDSVDMVDLLQTPFAEKVRQLLVRDLKDNFPKEADAAQFAFNNKWLPVDLKDPTEIEKIFNEFKQDISEANHWREDLVGIDSDKTMAVGLTWFMVIFQLNQRLNS